VSLIDVAENQPPVVNNQSFSVNENSANGTTGRHGGILRSGRQSLTLFHHRRQHQRAFAINASTGVLTVANSAVLDYETVTQFSLTVRR